MSDILNRLLYPPAEDLNSPQSAFDAAADTIVITRKLKDAAEISAQEWREKWFKAEEENARLRAALEPYSAMCDSIEKYHARELSDEDKPMAFVHMADLRRARTALKGTRT